jgi:MoaA/NifB/PqqE/SkfB family radical SAM enzyme
MGEMTIQEWKKCLLNIKNFVGEYFINFSGGEPLIKSGIIELMMWCHKNKILFGVTTNGSTLTPPITKRLVMAHPFSINISVDGPNSTIHDQLRGHPGLFEKICTGIGHIREYQKQTKIRFPIIIKSTINSTNFRVLPDMVNWAVDVGATCLHFQPVDQSNAECKDELWIKKSDHDTLQEIIEQLVKLKKRGLPILNSRKNLELITPYFIGKSNKLISNGSSVGLQNFSIRPNGDVELGFKTPSIGNLLQQTAQEIWYSEKAEKAHSMLAADRSIDLHTHLTRKTILDKISMGLLLLNR